MDEREAPAAEALRPEDLAAEAASELPQREAMTLIDTAMAGSGPLPLDGSGATAPTDGTAPAGSPSTTTDPLAGSGLAEKLPLTNPLVG